MLLVFIVFFCPPVFSLSKPHVCFRTCAQADNVWACVFICVPARTCNYRSGHIFAPCACQHICGPSCQAIGIRFGVCVKVSLVLCGKTFKYSFQGSQAASCFCLCAAKTKSLTQESFSRLHLFKNVHFFFARLFNLSSNNTKKEQVLEAVLTAALSLSDPTCHLGINSAANWTNFPLIAGSANQGCKRDDELKRSREAQWWLRKSNRQTCTIINIF